MNSSKALRHATAHSRFQITTDGFAPYRSAIRRRCRPLRLRPTHQGLSRPARWRKRYSPAEVHPRRWSQSWATRPRAHLHFDRGANQSKYHEDGTSSITRLTNAFSKKWENHWAAVAFWFAGTTLARPQVASHDSRDGCGNCGSHLERAGTVGGGMSDRICLMPWYKVTLTHEDIAARKGMALQDAFAEFFVAFGAPEKVPGCLETQHPGFTNTISRLRQQSSLCP